MALPDERELFSFTGTDSVIHMQALLCRRRVTSDASAVPLISEHSQKGSVRRGVMADDTSCPKSESDAVLCPWREKRLTDF